MNNLVKEFVFEPILFKKYQILTSKTIQKNYFEAVGRRKSFDIEDVEYLLIKIPVSKMNRKNVCKNEKIAGKNAKNVDIFQQRREEKRRIEKRRVKKKLLRVVVRVKAKKALSVTFGLTQK